MTPLVSLYSRFPVRQRVGRAGMALVGVSAVLAMTALTVVGASSASAAGYENSVGLGTVTPYSALGGSTVTNTGPSVLSGDLGVSPGNSATGFGTPPLGLVNGATNLGNAASASAQSALTTAYLDAAGRPFTSNVGAALMGANSLLPGVYRASSALEVGGTLTLDGQGDPNSVFIFQVGSALTTDTGTAVVLTGAAQACNVFWQVTSSATIEASNTFVGTIMTLASITVNNATTIQGRALARSAGQVTLINDVFTSPACATTPTTTTVTASPATAGGSTTLTARVATAPGVVAPAGTVTFSSSGVVIGTAPVINGVATLTTAVGAATGPRNYTAQFSGLGSYTPSTSTATVLLVTVVPVVTTVPTVPVSATPQLPNTGVSDIGLLGGTGGALVLAGVGRTAFARRRPIARRSSGL
jgi:hypothetical protein